MMLATPSASRVLRWTRVAAVASLAFAPALVAQNAPPAAGAGSFSVLQGFVLDSIHDGPLVSALVTVEGTGRSGKTTAEGRYRIDSIPAGSHRVVVIHPLLDTIGISMRTPAYNFAAGEAHSLDLSIPGGERLASLLCTPAQRTRGPAVMLGFVRDPDTNGAASGSKVQLVFQIADVIGRKTPITRESVVDSTGLYKICGLPADMSGKVQVFRNGVSSGEVPVEVTNGLALRAFSIVAQHENVAVVKNDSGRVTRVAKGSARVTGKVMDKNGRPLEGARVTLQGGAGGNTAITKANGEFTLDSLPSGTQALVVRKLGFAVTEAAVELAANTPARTEVKMGDFVPTLAKVTIEAAKDKALADVGYLGRKQGSMGYFMDGDMINHESMSFSDVMRMAPGLRVSPTGDGRTYAISDARNSSGGCVNYWVDGTPWETMTPGDIDGFVRPNEMVAVEVYHGAQAPPQFTKPGQSSCAAIVVWTVARVRNRDDSNARRRP
ncbi:MAG TPA: carboxypeptidase regulatory-like domain-containing protein [Gemmatimonadaceae bacterium]